MVTSDEDYVALAVRLIQDAKYRYAIRAQIKTSRVKLFNDIMPFCPSQDINSDTPMDKRITKLHKGIILIPSRFILYNYLISYIVIIE